eukprot:Phypoly_transcript_15004.p1 GENE.Phypoly_transcript_15004~~Phypoly_transcript_15004.p1  ORF type:complete len:183 (+),score=19.28 Phypoly_transcript_15004:392-940(+)
MKDLTTTVPHVIIRNMLLGDVSGVLSVQTLCYPTRLHETEEVFVSKIKFCPTGCFVAEDATTKSIIGYMISHPWKDGVKMELHNSGMDMSSPADLYYVHDTAVLQEYRSLKLGGKLFAKALEQCRHSNFSKIKIVSLPHAVEYWKRHGFKHDHDDAGKTETYGEVYPMSLFLLPNKHLADSF